MHTVVHMLSKPSLFPSISLFFTLFAVFPLPALSYLPYLLSLSSPMRPLSSTDKENRGGGKKERQQGGMRRERRCGETLRQRAGRLIWDDTHTHTYAGTQGPLFGGFAAGPCDHIDWVWWTCGPSFFLSPPFISSRLVSWWRNGSRGNRKSYSDFFGGPITTVSDVKVVSSDWYTDLGEAQRKLVKFKCKSSLLNLTRGI